jgi:hypothetical protein
VRVQRGRNYLKHEATFKNKIDLHDYCKVNMRENSVERYLDIRTSQFRPARCTFLQNCPLCKVEHLHILHYLLLRGWTDIFIVSGVGFEENRTSFI